MGFFFGLCLAAVVGFLVAQDANKRGMSGVGWGVATFLFCIVFLPLYLLMRKPLLSQSIPALQFAPQAPPRLCASCGKYHEGMPTFCPHCGAPQNPRLS